MDKCPHCGYCPHCKRANPPAPRPVWVYPYHHPPYYGGGNIQWGTSHSFREGAHWNRPLNGSVLAENLANTAGSTSA